ncbi:hypothetical protein Tco_0161794 [Tanacetum coccineum]
MVRMMRTLGKTAHPPYTLPPAIEAAIAKEITTPLHERYKSSFLSSLSSSLPPLPSTPSSPPSDMLPPCQRFRMASPHPYTTGEATAEALLARLHRRVEARRWALVLDSISHVPLVIGEPIHHTIPLLVARLIRHEDQIERIQDHLKDLLLKRVESMDQEKKMPTTRQGMGSVDIEQLIAQCVANAMIAYEVNRNSGNGVHNETSASAGGVEPTPRGCVGNYRFDETKETSNETKGSKSSLKNFTSYRRIRDLEIP